MTRKARFVVTLILVFGYFLIKYAIDYTDSKFGQGLNFIVLPLLYFTPAFLFLLAIFLLSLSLPSARRVTQFALSIMITIAACAFVRSFYDNTSVNNYFEELNTGYSYPKAEDFRLEYFILFIVNLLGFFFYIRRRK